MTNILILYNSTVIFLKSAKIKLKTMPKMIFEQ